MKQFLFRSFTIPINLHGHVRSFSLHDSGQDKYWLPYDADLCKLCEGEFFKLDSPYMYVGVAWQRLKDWSVQSVDLDKSEEGAFNAKMLLTFECAVNIEYPARTDVDAANALFVKGLRINRRNSHTDDAVIFLGPYRVTNVRIDSEFGDVQQYEVSEEDWRD